MPMRVTAEPENEKILLNILPTQAAPDQNAQQPTVE